MKRAWNKRLAVVLVVLLALGLTSDGAEPLNAGQPPAITPRPAPLTDSPARWTVHPTDPRANFTHIQAAIDAAAAGDLIEVWNGTYAEHVVVDKQLNIYSRDGPAATIVDANGTGSALRVTADGCTLSGFTIIGATDEGVAGISLEGVTACSITNNDLLLNNRGIQLLAASYNQLARNSIASSTQWDLYLQASPGNTFTANTVASFTTTFSFTCHGDLALSGVAEPPEDPEGLRTITKYLYVQPLTSGAWLDLKIHYTIVDLGNVNESTLQLYRYAGEGWELVPSWTNLEERVLCANLTSFSILAPFGLPLPPVRNLNTSKNFTTIQEAIDDPETEDGHVLEVAPGQYLENILIYKALTIRSYYDHPKTTIVTAANPDYDIFALRADNITIRGLTIEAAEGAAGVYIASNGNTIEHNHFYSNYVAILAAGTEKAEDFIQPAPPVGVSETPGVQSTKRQPEVLDTPDEATQTIELQKRTAAAWTVSGPVLLRRLNHVDSRRTTAAPSFTGIIRENGLSGANCIRNNIMSGNYYGTLLSNSGQNTIADNELDANYGTGLYLEYSGYNTICNNSARFNGLGDVGSGIVVIASQDNNISNNDVTGNYDFGIFLGYGASGNKVERNTANLNYMGILLYDGCTYNSITNNVVEYNYYEGISLNEFCEYNLITENTARYTKVSSGIALWDSCSHNFISTNNASSNELYAGIAAFRKSDNNTIANNLVSENMIGIILYSEAGGRNNTIVNNHIDDNFDGLVIWDDCNDNLIAYNSVIRNQFGGIYIVNASNNTIIGNNCSYSELGNGIELQATSRNNTIDRNTFTANDGVGIGIWDSVNYNTITNNTVRYNRDHGIQLTNTAHNNTLMLNSVCSNKLGGITLLRSAADNTIAANVLSTNLVGIGVLRYEGEAPSNNSIHENTVRECESGIMLGNLQASNPVTTNTVVKNRLFGIVTINTTGSVIRGNTARENKRGIGLVDSYAMQVIENTADFNAFSGISLFNSTATNVTANSAICNVYEGVHLVNSQQNTITHNNCSSNYFGIVLYSSLNNTIVGNTANDIYYFPVFLFDSDPGENTIDVEPYVQEETIHGVRMFIPETITPAVQAVEHGVNATYFLVIENLGILTDTFTLIAQKSDPRSLVSFDRENISLGPGESSARITEQGLETITLNVSGPQPGIYRTTVEVVSQNETTVKDRVECWTIVRGTVNSTQSGATTVTDSVLMNSAIGESTITRSAIINSSITQATITESIVRESSVRGTVLNAVILEDANITNGNISTGAITINGIRYVIQHETAIDALDLGAHSSESNLVGLRGQKLLVLNASNATIGFEISASEDYFAGSLIVQKAVIPPDDIREFQNSTGEYYVVAASENLANSTGWLLLKIYYEPSKLVGFNLSSLTIWYFNESKPDWEELIGQVNTTGHYVWVNISHYSVFAILAQPTGGGRALAPGGAGVARDADRDGLSDLEELLKGTDSKNPDTDGDGLSDSLDPYPLDPSVPARPTATPAPGPTLTTPSAAPTPQPSAPTPTPTPKARIPAPTGIVVIDAVLVSALLRVSLNRSGKRRR